MKTLYGLLTILSLTLFLTCSASSQTGLLTLDGERINIEGQNGKVVVLAIGASWLPLSATQAEATNALAKRYAGKNVTVYFVATDSTNPKSKNYASNDAIRSFASENKLGVTILRDSDGAITLRKFKVEQMPSFVILDKQGSQVGEPFGGIDPKYDISIPISKEINKLL